MIKVITSIAAADQPAGAERHDRSGARRRGGQGLRGGRQRSEGAGQGDGQGDRGHQPEDRSHPDRHQGRGVGDRADRQVINQINDIQNTIASAVEEQTATTNEISRNVAEAAKGGSEIAKNITGVAEAARSTTAGAVDTQKSAQSLERMAAELQELVSQFKYDDHKGTVGRAALFRAASPTASMSRRYGDRYGSSSLNSGRKTGGCLAAAFFKVQRGYLDDVFLRGARRKGGPQSGCTDSGRFVDDAVHPAHDAARCRIRGGRSRNGMEALDRLKNSGQVAVALVDWNMPVMNGFEFLCAARINPLLTTSRS